MSDDPSVLATQVTMQLGKKLTRGLGAGARPEIGRQAIAESSEEVRKVLEGATTVEEILVGPSNDNHIVVEAGLEPGDRVMLRDPDSDAAPLGGEALPGFLDVVSPEAP